MAKVLVYYDNYTHKHSRRYRRGYVERPRPADGIYRTNNLYYDQFGTSSNQERPNGNPLLPPYVQAHVTQFAEPAVKSALREASANFKKKAKGDTAEWGISIAQWKSSLGMISNRCNTLTRFAKLIPGGTVAVLTGNLYTRRRALRRLAGTLRVSNTPEAKALYRRSANVWRRRIRTPGDLFLEFWFGWSPLVNDIYQGIDVLQSPVKQGSVKLRGYSSPRPITGTYGSQVTPTNFQVDVISGTARAGIYTDCEVTNPNLYLANKMGLINPATIVLDAIPFSWLLGWFVNLKQVTDHLTWDCGLSMPIATRGHGTFFRYTVQRRARAPGWPSALNASGTVYRKERILGFPQELKDIPSLRFQAPTGSWSRAGVSLSLLLQHLSKF